MLLLLLYALNKTLGIRVHAYKQLLARKFSVTRASTDNELLSEFSDVLLPVASETLHCPAFNTRCRPRGIIAEIYNS
jgi:hypothetical protein